jgi:hypothetical protein
MVGFGQSGAVLGAQLRQTFARHEAVAKPRFVRHSQIFRGHPAPEPVFHGNFSSAGGPCNNLSHRIVALTNVVVAGAPGYLNGKSINSRKTRHF